MLSFINDGNAKQAISGWNNEEETTDPVDQDLDHALGALDDLTQEDKFFLIQ
jgi:hypothetical protein